MNENSEYDSTVVVTRHSGLVDYLVYMGMVIPYNDRVVEHATKDDVRDKHVIGVLPLRLAALAKTVTEIPLDIPAELRGQELTKDQVRQYAGEPVTYSVNVVPNI